MHELDGLPVCLPKFDKISFFLDNLHMSKSPRHSDGFRQRSNSCSLNFKRVLRFDCLCEKKDSESDRRKKPESSKLATVSDHKNSKFLSSNKQQVCQSFQLRKNYYEKVNTVCKQTKFSKQEVAVFDSSKQSEATRVKYEKKCKNSITPNLQNVHKHEDCINERLFSIKTDQTAVKHKKQKKRGCSLTGEQEMLATILQINPNARQNISLVRHGSLPPLRL